MSFASITPAQVYATTYKTLLASRMKQGFTEQQARENVSAQMENQLSREIAAGRMTQDVAGQIRQGFQTATPQALPTANPSAPAPAPQPAAPTAAAQPPAAPNPSSLQMPTYANPRTQAYFDEQLMMAKQYGPEQASKLASEATARMMQQYPDVYGGAVTQPSAYVAPQQASAPVQQSGSYSTQKANDYYAEQFQRAVPLYGAAQAANIAKTATDEMVQQYPSVYGSAAEAPAPTSGWGEAMPGAVVYDAGGPTSGTPAPTGYNVQSATQNPFQEAMGQGTPVPAQFTGSGLNQLQQMMTQAPASLEDYGPAVAQKVAALQLDGSMPYTSLADMAAYAQLLLQGKDATQAQAQIANHYNNPVGSTLDQITQGTLNGIGGAAQAATSAVKPVLDPIANAMGGTIPVIGMSTATPPPNPTDAQMTQQINNAAQAGVPQPNVIPPNPGGTYTQNPIGQFETPLSTYSPSGGQAQQTTNQPLDPTPVVAAAGGVVANQGGTTPTGGSTSTSTTTEGGGTVTPTPTGGTTAPAGSWWQDPAVAAYLASGIASAGGAIWSAKAQSDAAKEAATIQATAANNALTEQQRQFNAMMAREKVIYDDQAAMGAPWRDAGGRALTQLENFDTTNPNFGTAQFNADPGYSFRLSEGRKALENSAAARGGLLSGNTLKGISDYGQQSASQEYQNAFNRYQTERGSKLNRLQSLAGIGQSAVQQAGQAGQNYANATGQASQNYANGVGSSYMNAANAQAGGIQGAASANASGWMGAANSLTNALSGYYNNMQSQNMLNALTRR